MPAISVIIPCYNSEQYIERAIESVLKQSFKDYELILVDNNSTDRTGVILQNYANANPHFIKVFHEPRLGAPFARNKGLSEANGEWLQFLDSDDEILPDKLKNQFELTKKDVKIDVVVGSFYELREGINGLNKKIIQVKPGNLWEDLLKSNLGKTSSILWKKDAVIAAGGWNETISSSQEYDLLFRMLQNGINIYYSSIPQTNHYVVKNSISRSDNDERMMDILNNYISLRINIKNYLISKGEYSKKMEHAFCTSIYSKLNNYKNRFPSYVEKKRMDLNLKLPLQFTISNKLSAFKATVKKILRLSTKSNIKM
jgi:glycosyltransferase involved in cell wall biosynthesis